MTRHVIVLVRHAKAEQHNPDDHSRQLTTRGKSDAAVIGAALMGTGLMGTELAPKDRAAVALVSSGVRAVQTWEQISAGLVPGSEAAVGGTDIPSSPDIGVRILDELYVANEDDVLNLLGALDESVHTAIVVGHNPTIANLAWDLHDTSEVEAFTAMKASGYSPGTATIFSYDGEWAALRRTTAVLETYLTPRTSAPPDPSGPPPRLTPRDLRPA